jgi:ubiquinone/menaquinone biosynthesis C-methylase UbiE
VKKLAALRPQQEIINGYFQAESSYWRDVYTCGDVQAENIQDRHAAILAWIDDLHLAPGSSVLDIGCGAGFMAIALSRRGFRVHAVDTVDAMVELAKGNAGNAGIIDMPSFSVDNVHALSFGDSLFDLVTAIGVIPWLERPEPAIREMARVTKPGGHIILTTSNSAGLNNLLDPLICPPLQPFKRGLKTALVRLGLRHQTPNKRFQSIRYIDRILRDMGLVKLKGMTRGFAFSFLHRPVFPEPLGIKVNRSLQRLADMNVPGFRSIGRAYIVLTRKSASRV